MKEGEEAKLNHFALVVVSEEEKSGIFVDLAEFGNDKEPKVKLNMNSVNALK